MNSSNTTLKLQLGECPQCRTKTENKFCDPCIDKSVSICSKCKKYPAGWWSRKNSPKCYYCVHAAQAETQAQNAKAVEEVKETIAAETLSKKEEALKPSEGRNDLGHWVDDVVVKIRGEEPTTVRFLTKVTSVSAANVKPEKQEWLWHNRIPAGAITWGVGKAGNGKSLWSTDLAARISSGADFPDCKNEMGPQKVLMYACEDSISTTIVPRLIAAGANLDNVQILDGSSFETYDKEYNRVDRRSIDLSQDIKIISEVVKKHPDIKLLIIDPITGVFGSANTNHDKDMRPIMNGLKDMLEKRKLTLVGIAHTNKRGETAAAIDQIQGASSIPGASRAAWLFTKDPESDDEHAHLMSCIKGNLASNHDGLKFLTRAVSVENVGDHPMVIWGESTKMQADDTNQAIREKRESKHGKRDTAKLAILTLLGDKPQLSGDVYKALEKQGHSSETIKRAAGELTDEREILRRQKDKRWFMLLPTHLLEFDQELEPQEHKVMSLSAGEVM